MVQLGRLVRLTLAAVALVASPTGCRRSAGGTGDAGQDVPARFDTLPDVSGAAGASGSGGAQGGATGAAGAAGVGAAAGAGGAPGGGGAGTAGAQGGASGSLGGGGFSGASGSAGAGGAAAPLFPCIQSWPARPAGVQKSVPLSVSPGVLWTKDLPLKGSPISWPMAVTGTGVAMSFGDRLLIYDGDGNQVASVTKPQQVDGGKISSPVAGPDGSLYFADRSYAYRVDGMGQPVWQKPLGADQSGGRGPAPREPVLDPAGHLYVSALDGKLWTFRGEDGQVLSSSDLGIWQYNPRYPYVGIGEVLAIDRSGTAAAGPGVSAMGLFLPQTGAWLGEVTIGDGSYPVGAYAGYEIGIVATAYLDAAERTETDAIDKCGNLRWRVPGSYSVPLAVTFDDDLIVMDRVPNGRPAPSNHDFSLRRFSKDGALVAGPVSVSDTFCGQAFVGADDTFYYTGGASDGYRLRAFDSSLREIWVIPFPHCPDAAVLSPGGKIFTARGADGKLVAVQTTSPGLAPVSWAQAQGRDARATRWLAP